MEDINLGIFVVLMLGIALWYHPQQTIKIVMLPFIGLYVVMEVLVAIFSRILFGKTEGNK
ncbi:MAG: hypothetical protein ACW98D_21210 [Promethearchaeota archaeon]|jgi:hypothetical protein